MSLLICLAESSDKCNSRAVTQISEGSRRTCTAAFTASGMIAVQYPAELGTVETQGLSTIEPGLLTSGSICRRYTHVCCDDSTLTKLFMMLPDVPEYSGHSSHLSRSLTLSQGLTEDAGNARTVIQSGLHKQFA